MTKLYYMHRRLPDMRTPDFEDRSSCGWPAHLLSLKVAAGAAYQTYAELEYMLRSADKERKGVLLTLAGTAYSLLEAIRADGEAQLAAWEAKNDDQAADDEAEYQRMRDAEIRVYAPENW